MMLLATPPTARRLRHLASRIIHQDAVALDIDPTRWHIYQIEWTTEKVHFSVDRSTIMTTSIVPHPPLGLALWIDNQYATLPPDGKLRLGTLPTTEKSWVEIENLRLDHPA